MYEYMKRNRSYGDCAIVGIWNSMVFLGKEPNYSEIKRIARNCFGYSTKRGLECRFIDDLLSKFDIPAKLLQTRKEAENKIANGSAGLAAITNAKTGLSHMIFLKYDGNDIEVYNLDQKWAGIVESFKRKDIKLAIWEIQK